MGEKLDSVAATLRAVEIHLAASIARLREVAAQEILDELFTDLSRITDAAADVEERARLVAAAEAVVADRINNLLMGMQTISDLREHAPEVRERLRSTVENGRAAVAHIRRTLADL